MSRPLESGPETRGPDMEGALDYQFASHPKETGNGVTVQNNAADPNAKSYDSPPVKMDYYCDMGLDS